MSDAEAVATTRKGEQEKTTHIEEEFRRWEARELADALRKQPESQDEFRTLSGIPLKRIYTSIDARGRSELDDLGFPGQYPFTRGPYPSMYRGRPWTMREFAGFGTAADTNTRFKYLIAHGQTGLSVAFDMPTLMGYDADHPMAHGEVGREGVAVSTLADMERLFDGIDLSRISVSMTINATAWILLAMYFAVAQKRGYDPEKISGTIQNDILKEYIAQKEWIYPVRPSMRLVRDSIAFSVRNFPRYNPISISGYHISEAGANAVQEAAFTLADAIAYTEVVLEAGVRIDDFAPRLSFFFIAQADFFEEIAKFRALRRCYAKIMKERFGAKTTEAMRLRFHCQTAAATLTKSQYKVNLMRTGFQALAAVLGGAQSLHTNGFDEAFTIPTEEATKLALRTQQVIAEEMNVTAVVDPLGGSYFMESLTDTMEREIFSIIDEVDGMGGTVEAIEQSWFQSEIADSAYRTALRRQSGELAVIGVNRYIEDDEEVDFEAHPYDPMTEKRQIGYLNEVRQERDNSEVTRLLGEIQRVAQKPDENIMPITIELVKAGASIGEIVEALRDIWGTYRETSVI